ncbi:TPA: hypothetical protein DEP58_00890 [Patescibacteria group bacterium]|nr:MAG: hypothetical protein UU98_C0007G0011 [Parcubacteria group bacterium GW2011_GWD2_42_14]HCC04845.1 hypothetical protein [Patescibacteria group bacterium]
MGVNTQVAVRQAFLFGMLACFFAYTLITTTVLVFAEEPLPQGEIEDAVPVEVEVEAEAEVDGSIPDTSMGLSTFSVSPVVANEKAKPRDIIKKEVIVTNNTDKRVDVYISVENIDPTEGAKEFVGPGASDLSTSLANWVEITRGVIDLDPRESRKIPYLIHVNLSAKPGSYYARLQFREGARRTEAEAGIEGSALMLNVEVEDNAIERLQLGNFISEDSVVLGNSVSFSYLLENVGNRLLEPRGSIRIFNRKGEEVGSIPLNADGEEINPENKRQLAASWSAVGRFGKYKAFLDLEYGENQLASVQDTVYFWVFPWKEITAALMGVLVLAVVGTYIVHMSSMAQPARARKRAEARVDEDLVERSDVRRTSRIPQVSARIPQTHTSVTHLHLTDARQAREQVSRRNEAHTYGATVTLAPRDTKGNTKTHGNVIQLSSRR